MADVRVVIVYTDELESISIDNMEMDDISAIQNKPIRDWFSVSNGRDGWEGLIPEIQKVIDDETATLNFEFHGPQESKHIFEECIGKLGFGTKVDGLSADNITERNLEDARKAEHRGFHKRAFECYVNAADYGQSAEAQFKVAEYYYKCYQGEFTEISVSPNNAIANAVEYYEKAAMQNNVSAQCRLYELFSQDQGVKKNPREAAKWLKIITNRKVSEIQDYGLIRFYLANAEEIVKLMTDSEQENFVDELLSKIEEAANNGNREACVHLAGAYQAGAFGEKDDRLALKWYKRAAEMGVPEAQFIVAGFYLQGIGTEIDMDLAFKWTQEAAKNGIADAQAALASFHELADTEFMEDVDVEENPEASFEWAKKAAQQGDVTAQALLGRYYRDEYGTTENPELSFKWIQKAAQQGEAEAQIMLGEFYCDGYGTEENPELSFKWYLKAAQQGEAEAQFWVSRFYSDGYGVARNPKAAFEWGLKAAEQGDAVAQKDVGDFYDEGIGVTENKKAAFKWYLKAAQQGYANAQFSVGVCYEQGSGVAENPNAAFEWYLKAAKQGLAAAECSVGVCYYKSIGTVGNYVEAKKWFKRAVNDSADDAELQGNICIGIATTIHGEFLNERIKKMEKSPAISGWKMLLLGSKNVDKKERLEFLKTDKGMEMIKYYHMAVDLGNRKALELLKEWE